MDPEILPGFLIAGILLGLFLYWLSRFKRRARKIKDYPNKSDDGSSVVFLASRGAPDKKESGPDEGSVDASVGGLND